MKPWGNQLLSTGKGVREDIFVSLLPQKSCCTHIIPEPYHFFLWFLSHISINQLFLYLSTRSIPQFVIAVLLLHLCVLCASVSQCPWIEKAFRDELIAIGYILAHNFLHHVQDLNLVVSVLFILLIVWSFLGSGFHLLFLGPGNICPNERWTSKVDSF